MKQSILIVDDDDDILSALSLLLQAEGFTPIKADSPAQAIAAIRQYDVSLILMDLNYSLDTTSGEEGLNLINTIRQHNELVPIVVMTGWGTIEVAVAAIKSGADDFIQKPWENDRLLMTINNQIRLAQAQKQSQKLIRHNELLQAEIRPATDIVAESAAMQRVLETLHQVARSDASILLTGENGTGKSLFARLIHELSTRRHAPHISVNMGAVTESLFESEMFGHTKGAFTDAKSARIGRFELADEGTLFLDEIANTPYSPQGKLLRVLEDRQFEKVGSGITQTVDFRLVTATNAELNLAVNAGSFRKDLLYRINTVEIEIPALRYRPEDILPLASAFLAKAAQKYSQPSLEISSAAEKLLQTYAWPGNVRELNHVMERAHILCKTSAVQPSDLGINSIAPVAENIGLDSEQEYLKSLSEMEQEIINRRLSYFGGDALKAAKSLGLSRSAFYRRLEKHEQTER